MMYASALAGMGFGNTQNGIIHAIGTTLPVECHIPHGLAMSFCAPFSVASTTSPIPRSTPLWPTSCVAMTVPAA